MTVKIFQVKDFILEYSENPKVDGGGTSIGLDFVNLLRKYYPEKRFDRCLDWCSGPGFIGFSLLLNNFCRELCLVDSYEPALNSARMAIADNKLLSVTKIYNIDSIKDLPAQEKFDLIVANPPHFPTKVFHQESIWKNSQRIYLDLDWQVHIDFFQNIKKNLTHDGTIILQESSWACNHDTFDRYLDQANLKVSNVYQSVDLVVKDYPIFYLEIKHK